MDVCKIAPPVAVNIQQTSKSKIVQEAASSKAETDSAEGLCLLEENAHTEQIAVDDSFNEIPLHDRPEVEVHKKKG